MFTDYYFWFSQPSIFLLAQDKLFGYIFIGLIALSIVLVLLRRFIKNPIMKKLIGRFFYLTLTIGISGLIWYGLRFEATPIFAQRYWAGLVFLSGIIWILFILKYMVFNFSKQLGEYHKDLLKKKYL
jgi:hypothetical protein